MKRVVVTGMGLVTPFGCGKLQNWNSLISAKSGATKITKFDSTKYKGQHREIIEKQETDSLG